MSKFERCPSCDALVDTESSMLPSYDCCTPALELETLQERADHALAIAFDHGGGDEAHHKAWVIDQMVRALLPGEDEYTEWVRARRDGEDGPETYAWDEGIAP